jgi:hypothetical protein
MSSDVAGTAETTDEVALETAAGVLMTVDLADPRMESSLMGVLDGVAVEAESEKTVFSGEV